MRPERLEGRKVAVVAGTAHEAYLKSFFTEVELRPYPNAEAAREAVRRGETDLLFGDGIALAFWLNGSEFRGMLRVQGRARSPRAAISAKGSASRCAAATRRLRLALNWALFRLWERGQFTDLWLRYFPVSPF